MHKLLLRHGQLCFQVQFFTMALGYVQKCDLTHALNRAALNQKVSLVVQRYGLAKCQTAAGQIDQRSL